MGLHTLPGCTAVSPVQDPTTLINSTDCSYVDNSNEGCTYTPASTAAYGAGFSAVGGGVYVTEFAETGISSVTSPPSTTLILSHLPLLQDLVLPPRKRPQFHLIQRHNYRHLYFRPTHRQLAIHKLLDGPILCSPKSYLRHHPLRR